MRGLPAQEGGTAEHLVSAAAGADGGVGAEDLVDRVADNDHNGEGAGREDVPELDAPLVPGGDAAGPSAFDVEHPDGRVPVN